MVAMNPNMVAKQVQDELNRRPPHASRVRVLADQVRPGSDDGAWWYVPVSYLQDPYNAYAYYEAFSDIEEKLEEQQVSVLLVPRIIHHPDESSM